MKMKVKWIYFVKKNAFYALMFFFICELNFQDFWNILIWIKL